MEILTQLIDLIVHVDTYLQNFVQAHGTLVYALLFAIIFVETGVVVMPFLPGDSLLFIVGAMCATGHLSLPIVIPLLIIAAILGDQTNYSIGRFVGDKALHWENSWFFKKAAFDKAHSFYEQYGPVMIIVARFMPFVRTFVPFVAGVAQMTRLRFITYNVIGGVLWIVSLTILGYRLGNIPRVKANLEYIIWGLILIPASLAVWGLYKKGRKS